MGNLIDNWSLRKARRDTRLIYIPGNHNENFRNFLDLRFGCVAVREEAVHLSPAGKRFLVLHGDKSDGVVRSAPWITKLGGTAYELSMELNRWLNGIGRFFRLPYWPPYTSLKNRAQRAIGFISHFEEAMARNCHGVICGHIHTPDNRMIDDIHYLNDSDSLESCTTLAEHRDGTFQILNWNTARIAEITEETHAHSDVTDARYPQANGVVRTINREGRPSRPLPLRREITLTHAGGCRSWLRTRISSGSATARTMPERMPLPM